MRNVTAASRARDRPPKAALRVRRVVAGWWRPLAPWRCTNESVVFRFRLVAAFPHAPPTTPAIGRAFSCRYKWKIALARKSFPCRLRALDDACVFRSCLWTFVFETALRLIVGCARRRKPSSVCPASTIVGLPVSSLTSASAHGLSMTMKEQNEQQQAISRCLAKVAEGRVGRNGRKERDLNHEEMQSLLAKLKELVPNMPRNKKLTKLEVIQYVIDYILDLQIALETHPANRSSSHPAGSSTSPARQPLGALPPSANAVANTCPAQEVTHTDKIPSHLADLMSTVVPPSRPVSC